MDRTLNILHRTMLDLWADFVRLLPNIVAGIVLFTAAWFLSRYVERAIVKGFSMRRRGDLGNVLGSLASFMFKVLAFMVACAIVFPSISPADLFATLGIGSVAFGFAFKDILQNILAGLLLLWRHPFQRGDQINVANFEGTVQEIQSRATRLSTGDGRIIYIPNSIIFTAPVTINSPQASRRSEVMFRVNPDADIEALLEKMQAAVASIEGVQDKPQPSVVITGIPEGAIEVTVRWWTTAKSSDAQAIRARVWQKVMQTARGSAIELV